METALSLDTIITNKANFQVCFCFIEGARNKLPGCSFYNLLWLQPPLLLLLQLLLLPAGPPSCLSSISIRHNDPRIPGSCPRPRLIAASPPQAGCDHQGIPATFLHNSISGSTFSCGPQDSSEVGGGRWIGCSLQRNIAVFLYLGAVHCGFFYSQRRV